MPKPNRGPMPIINDLDLDKIKRLARKGLTKKDIAARMGIKYKTLINNQSKSSELRAALSIGKSIRLEQLMDLKNGIMLGSKTPRDLKAKIIMHELERKHGWNEKVEHDVDMEYTCTVKTDSSNGEPPLRAEEIKKIV